MQAKPSQGGVGRKKLLLTTQPIVIIMVVLTGVQGCNALLKAKEEYIYSYIRRQLSFVYSHWAYLSGKIFIVVAFHELIGMKSSGF